MWTCRCPTNGRFVFSPAARVRTLRAFVRYLETQAAPALMPFVGRGDFSRWIREVFGDHALAAELRAIETRRRTAPPPDARMASGRNGAPRRRWKRCAHVAREAAPTSSMPTFVTTSAASTTTSC
jgi:hypothetical protein